MPLSSSNRAERWLEGIIDQGLAMQWLSVKAQWEPALIQTLAPMAEDCLARTISHEVFNRARRAACQRLR